MASLGAPEEKKGKRSKRMSVMDMKKNSAKPTEGFLADLKHTTSNKKNAKRLMTKSKNEESIQALMVSLNTNPKFTKMVEYSLQCLKNLAVDHESTKEIIDAGVVEALQRVMKLNPYNEKIQRMVNDTLNSFILNDELGNETGKRLGGNELLHSMKKHTEPETVRSTTELSSKLLKYDKKGDCLESFTRGGAIPALAGIVQGHMEKVPTLAPAIECLDRIAGTGDQKVAMEVIESGVVENVLTSVANHTENERIVEHGIGLIGNLAPVSKDMVEKLKRMGAVDVLVSALELHGDNDRILELAQNAFACLAGVEDVGSALKVIPAHNLLTSKAISKVSSLLLVPENVDYMFRNKGQEWIMACIAAVKGKDGELADNILLQATRALGRMAISDPKIHELMRIGGVKALMAVLVAHRDDKDKDFALGALKSLTSMASRPENCAYLINQGLLEHADILYANEPDNEKVRNQVLDLYKAMAENGGQSVAPILMDQKGLLKALPMVAKFVEKAQVEGEPVYEENLAKQIIHMMGHLASTPSLMKRVIKEGGMDVLTRVMAACGPSLEVQMAGLQFMQAAVSTGDPEVLGQLRALGGVNAILKAVELHAANPQIQLAGSGLLAVVAGEEHMGTAIESVGAVIGRMQVAKDQAQMIGELASSISLLTNLIAVEGNADALMSAGVIDQLVNAIVLAQTQQPSQQRTDILNMASGSLVRLLPKDPARVVQAVISKKGLRPMLLAALEENEDLEPLVEYGATTAQACMAEESSLAQLFEDGIGEQMIELSQANPLNDRLLATAAGVVDVLASDEKKAKRLLEHGAAELAVQTGLSNIKEKEDLLTALALMAKLATVPGAIGQLVSAGALDLVLDAMKVHADDAEVMSACADTLAYLMQEESIAVMVGEKKGLNSVMDSLRKYQRDENISYKNLVVLDSLCSVEMNQEILKLNEDEFQTGKLVKTVASNHKDNLQIKNVATNILSMLDDNPEWMQEGLELDDAQAAEMLEGLDNDMVSEDIEQHRAKMIAMKTALANPANAVKVAQQSGLKALQTAMGKAIDDPDIWRAAASAFLSVLDFGEQTDGVLSDDELFGTLCSILGATEKHAKPIPLSDLSKAVRFLAKNRLTPAQVKMVMAHAKDIFNMICKTDDEDLLAQAARLLAKMTNDDANALALAQGVSIRELIYAMRRSFKNTTFLQYGVYLLGNLGCTPALKEEIGIEGGMQLILEIMKEHNKVQPLVESCCYGVATLTFDQFANANFVVAGDGIQTIVDRMDQYLAYYDLLDHAVLSLNNICVDRKQTQVDIVKSGGARAVVDALLQHFDKEEFAVSCLRCLATLSTAPVNIEGIIEGGAIQAMVACMTQFSEALELNALAIAVIGNLAADLSPKNQEIMAAEGAVQAVVETVNHHQDHVKLQMAVVQCLSNFCKVLQNVETFVGQQGPAAISEVIKTLHNRQYAAHAVRVLLACCKGSEEERESMIDQGVTDVLVEVIKTESGEKPIVGPAVRVLGMLAFNEEMVIKIMNRQNPLPILLVLLSKVYSKDDLVLTDICHTLNQFARNEEATNQMCEMVFKHTETIAGIHNSKRNLVMALLSLLTNIYAHEPCYASIPNTHTTDDILGLITLWKDKKDHAVMKKACNALLNMAYGPGPVKEHMKMRGVLQSMKLLQSENQGTELIVNAAEAVVMALNPMEFDPSKYKDLRGLIAKRSEILNDKPDEEIKTIELDKYTRNLLTDGVMMLKHSKKAVPRQRILKVDQELKWVIWCELHSHEAEAKNMMRVDHVQDVLKGRSTPQLNRKRYGKYLAKDENTLWSLKGRGRTVDFEAESESQREAYANAFEVLIQYKRACRVMGAAVF